MSVDLDRVSMLTGFVDKLIQIRQIESSLDECVLENLISEALRFTGAQYSNEEIDAAKRDLAWRYQIFSLPGQSILDDYEQEAWYDDVKSDIEPFFWTRYKNYLIDKKHFSPNVVSTLGEDTLDQKLMNYILNPNTQYDRAVLRRGLIIGDVQSGKTSTYIAFICKAADAGYKVFILLTGTIESLRKQTQERVEEGFIGIDMSSNSTGGKRVGVGLDNKPIKAMALTSRKGDFTGDSDKIAVALSDKTAVVFVIKKQKNVLTKLINWLKTLNVDPRKGTIDMPLLMIDDEADNASINTSTDKEDPTIINRLIRELASIFTKSNYVGFTATPFANVFIDPETTEKMETQDLFPEDFIVSLPTPSNYIGANRIFAQNGEFHSQLIYITDAGREEEDGFPFYFKHKKDWHDKLPESLTDAIYTFYLANALRDLRGDINAHRSMLVNISRFVKVQKYIKEEIEGIHARAYTSIKFNLNHDRDKSLKDPILHRIYELWEKHYAGTVEFGWDAIVDTLYQSIESIQIKVVNSAKSSEKLEYPENDSLRVIAIGGLALSRGLTLEGLIISYFYRNTSTYDVLMQMGRWFGYRKNYEDLFRIWIYKSSADWYGEISEATEELKNDMTQMRELCQRPRDFGIRVRNNSSELSITAYNKMRNAADAYEFYSYFGGIVETPYLHFNPEVHRSNYHTTEMLVHQLVKAGYTFDRQNDKGIKARYIIQCIPKVLIVDYIRKLKVSRFSSSFDVKQIADFLESTDEPCIEYFDLAFIEGTHAQDEHRIVDLEGRKISKVVRTTCIVDRKADRLGIGQRGKLGGTDDGKAGITDFGGQTALEIIEGAKQSYREDYQKKYGTVFDEKKKNYPSNTWFAFIKNRRPIILVYFIDVDISSEEPNQKKQIDELRSSLGDIPVVGFAMGLPQNDNASRIISKRYKANRVYNWFEQDEILAESDEEE